MSSVHSDPRVVSLTGRSGLATTLDTLVDQLNRCQKALNEFLEVSSVLCFFYKTCTRYWLYSIHKVKLHVSCDRLCLLALMTYMLDIETVLVFV